MTLHDMFPPEQSAHPAFLQRERHEIEKHAWVMGERFSRPVPYCEAQWDWIVHHRTGWIAAMKASGESVY